MENRKGEVVSCCTFKYETLFDLNRLQYAFRKKINFAEKETSAGY